VMENFTPEEVAAGRNFLQRIISLTRDARS
jgi:hypothetical protein